MADWTQPVNTTLYNLVLSILRDRDFDAGSLFVAPPTNPIAGMIRFDRTGNKFQEYDGTQWQDKILSVAGGGTGASTINDIRNSLGLGTMSTQNSNNVNITGGTITGVPIQAPSLVGQVPPASLGTGPANSGTWLRGDMTWQTIPAGVPTGCIFGYAGATPPASYVLCDGAAHSRTTQAALFAVCGTAFGAGDLSTTFNVPDLRQRFPMGKAASGTGLVLGSVGGAIDHVHAEGAHTHTIAAHAHTVASHVHSGASHTHGYSGGTSADGNHDHGGTQQTGLNADHSHSFSGGGTTGGENAGTMNVDAGNSGLMARAGHGHDFGYSGNTSHVNIGLTHGHNINFSGNHGHTFSGTTDAGSSGGNTGAAAPATDAVALTTAVNAAANTGANNPPFQVINFIIHV
jgi:microcystin-dependent protein